MKRRVAPAGGHARDTRERLLEQRFGALLAPPRADQRLDHEREGDLPEPLAPPPRRALERLLPAAPVEQASGHGDLHGVAGNRRLVVVEQLERGGGNGVDGRVVARIGCHHDAVDIRPDRLHVQPCGARVGERARQHGVCFGAA